MVNFASPSIIIIKSNRDYSPGIFIVIGLCKVVLISQFRRSSLQSYFDPDHLANEYS